MWFSLPGVHSVGTPKSTVCVCNTIKHKEWPLYLVAVNDFMALNYVFFFFFYTSELCLMAAWQQEITLVWLRLSLQLIPLRTSKKQAATWPLLPPSIKMRCWTGLKTRTLGELYLSTTVILLISLINSIWLFQYKFGFLDSKAFRYWNLHCLGPCDFC